MIIKPLNCICYNYKFCWSKDSQYNFFFTTFQFGKKDLLVIENVKYFPKSPLDTDPYKKQLLPTAKRSSKFIMGPSFELLDGSEPKFVYMFQVALSDSLTKENVCFWLKYQLLISNFDSTTPHLHLHLLV